MSESQCIHETASALSRRLATAFTQADHALQQYVEAVRLQNESRERYAEALREISAVERDLATLAGDVRTLAAALDDQ